jgi:hypothetical protein
MCENRPTRWQFTTRIGTMPLQQRSSSMDPLLTLGRRDLLKTSTGLLTGLIVAGSPLTAIAKSPVWAVDLTAFSTAQAATLLAAARTICPHDKLDDLAYALVVQSADADAHKDQRTHATFSEGLAQLGSNFATASESDRVAALKQIESTPFFQLFRVKVLQTLYASPMAYDHFGYEGEAFSKGGYLYRGFDDLRWLPEVPSKDSGAVPGKA